jgi:NAD(P)-dependent dehydrogenase (short-subunit alcohol dehydrogenase family)
MTERVRTSFGFASTTDEVLAGMELSGKPAIETGASSGIGVETARALAGVGADVVLAVRRVDAGEQVAAQIVGSTGNPSVTACPLDLADLGSVREFVETWQGPLHILVNNAGIMALLDLTRTAQGREIQFATNFLGHFALTTGLYEALAEAAGASVVSVTLVWPLRGAAATRPLWCATDVARDVMALVAYGCPPAASWQRDSPEVLAHPAALTARGDG